MSQDVGMSIPPPLRFEFGKGSIAGEPASALLLVTVDADGSPRIVVLSYGEVRVLDERRLRIVVRAGSNTRGNLEVRPAALWCVLDGAAYSLRGRARRVVEAPEDPLSAALELELESVLRDFTPDAPLISGPTYRRMT